MPAGIDRPVVCPLLIGREACLQALAESIDTVRGGHAELVLISGEAGIGKTRLVGALTERARAAGFGRTLSGACFEYDRTLPYAPFAEALRGLTAGVDPVGVVEQIGPELARLLPELGLRPNDEEPQQTRRRVLEGFVHLVRALAARGPLLCVIEDLHWSDDSSLEVLLTLARRLRNDPVLLVGTYRDDEVHSSLQAVLAELERGRLASEVRLTALDEPQVAMMLQATLALKRPVRARLVQQVFTLSDGNPFFIEELLRSMLATGEGSAGDGDRVYLQDLRMPRTVEESIRRRTGPLSAAAHAVLSTAAVLGRRFEFELLQRLTRVDDAELVGAVRELVASQLMLEEAEGRFAFRHALTREAIYSQLLSAERRSLHAQVARAIEQRDGQEKLEDLAYHFFEAGEWSKAASYAERAGDRARRLHATDAALQHYSAAIRATEREGRRPPSALLRKRASAYEASGDFPAALADYTSALARAEEVADDMLRCQALLDLGFLWAARDYARAGEYFQSALTLARLLEQPTVLADALNRVGNWYTNVEQPREAIEYHSEALQIAETLADAHAVAQTLDLLALATSMLGRLPHAVSLFDRSIRMHRELEDAAAVISSLSIRSIAGGSWTPWTVARCNPTALVESLAVAEEALRQAKGLDLKPAECFASHCVAEAATGRGQFGRALEVAEEGLLLAEEIGHDQWACSLRLIRGSVRAELFALDLARSDLQTAFEQAKALGSLIWTHTIGGELLALLVRLRGLDAADELSASLLQSAPETLSERLIRYAQARLALRRNKVDLALHLLEPLRADGSTPALDLLHAEILLSQQRPSDAERTLVAAAQWALAHHQMAVAWRLLALRVRALNALGNASEAAAARDTALDVVRRIAENSPERFRDEYLRCAHRALGVAQPRVARDTAGLTPREREVALLIGEGLSNRAIAGRLVVGARTIETHVSSILAKLNLSSRAQITAWVARQPGLDA